MPQVAIEYSANIAGFVDPRAVAAAVHRRLVDHAAAELANCKTRMVRLDDYLIGDGSDAQAMIHVDLRILPGRSDEQKKRLGEAVLGVLETAVAPPGGMGVQLTVEVRELDGPNYHKRRL